MFFFPNISCLLARLSRSRWSRSYCSMYYARGAFFNIFPSLRHIAGRGKFFAYSVRRNSGRDSLNADLSFIGIYRQRFNFCTGFTV